MSALSEVDLQTQVSNNLVAFQIEENNGDLVVTSKQFSPDTGLEMENPKVDRYTQSNLTTRKAELEQELANINLMLTQFS